MDPDDPTFAPPLLRTTHLRATRLLLPYVFSALLVIPSQQADAWQPPFFILGTELGQTTNLLYDSTGVDDLTGSLMLALDQPLWQWLTLYYDLGLSRLAETTDLSSDQHEVGLYARYTHREQEFWLSGSGSALSYGDYYESYDRRRFHLGAGLRTPLSDRLQLRGNASFSRTAYPGYDLSPGVDHDDLEISTGLNLSLDWPLALDLETGWQKREYTDSSSPLFTSLGFLRTRLSRPLGNRTGIVLQLYLREQLQAEQSELYALSLLGLNPGDLLWSGWQLQGRINHILADWRLHLTMQHQSARYLETSAITGTPQRDDTTLGIQLGARRAIPLSTLPLRLWLNLELYHQDNYSGSSYYTYTSTGLTAGFSVEPY